MRRVLWRTWRATGAQQECYTALDGALWFENDAGQEMCGACMVGVRPDLFAAAEGASGAADGGGGQEQPAGSSRKRPRSAAEEAEGEEDNLFGAHGGM